MKNLFLCSVAALAIAAAAPAKAEGIDLGLGGYFIGYGLYNNQDETAGESLRSFDFRKETEVHFNGETTLDNGLTVGGHVELNADRAIDADANNEADGADGRIEESYLYLSGGWGRVNFGEEDGAAYLLQVAGPSADDNIDGLRPDINTFDLGAMIGAGAGTATAGLGSTITDGNVLNYAADASGYANKLTYITPLFSGFQAGVSLTPSLDAGDVGTGDADNASGDPMDMDDDDGEFENAVDLAARYQMSWGAMDWTLGAGYERLQAEDEAGSGPGAIGSDDRDVWNVGARVGFGAFGIGAAYVRDNNGIDTDGDTRIWVAGADYVTGPFKIGASYYDREDEAGAPVSALGTTGDVDTTRWTAGVGYQYGPGMSLNGTIARVEIEDDIDSGDGYQVAIGTRVDF